MLSTTNYAYTYQHGTNNNHNAIYHKLRIHLQLIPIQQQHKNNIVLLYDLTLSSSYMNQNRDVSTLILVA